MRQLLSLITFSTIYFLASSFIISLCKAGDESIYLQDALAAKLIMINLSSTGDYSGNSVEYEITNLSSKKISLKIPNNTIFLPENSEEQTLIHGQEKIITINSKEKMKGILTGFCIESNDNCPTENSKFSIGINRDKKLNSLFKNFSSENISPSDFQHAVWAITDGRSVSNIVRNNSTNALRSYAAELAGQEDTWYSSPQEISVDELGRIVNTTTTITGELSFQCKKGASIQQDVHNSTGEKLISSRPYKTIRAGNITYTFKIKVSRWPKGDYYVRLHDEQSEIKKYLFKI